MNNTEYTFMNAGKLRLSMIIVFFSFGLSACGGSSNNTEVDTDTPDTIPPVLSLVGNATIELEAGTSYTDSGANATDNVDGDISARVSSSGSVDANATGTYSITYTVTDSSGNNATPVIRTVTVVDTTPPIISLIGDASITLEVGSNYTDAGASANDAVDGDITASIISTGSVDTNATGSYTITYTVKDGSDNNASPVTRAVTIVDTTPPVLSLNGDTNIALESGTTYLDLGASAMDNLDGDISANITTMGSVDTFVTGTYILMYNVNDASGNSAVSLSRTIEVVDTTSPLLLSTSPASDQTDVVLDTAISASFNESLLAASLNNTSVVLSDDNNNAIAGTVSLNQMGSVVSFMPNVDLIPNTQYTATISDNVSDLSANKLANTATWQFTTISTNDSSLPELINIPASVANEPQFAMNASGAGIAVWRQNGFINANRYDPQGGGWQGVEQISIAGAPRDDMKIDINNNGSAAVVWTETESTGNTVVASVYANRYSPANGWSGVEAVDEFPSGTSETADVGIDMSGNVLVVWRHRVDFQADGEIYRKRYVAQTNTWDVSQALDQDIPDIADNADTPRIAVNSAGYAIAVWVSGGDRIVAASFDSANDQWTASGSIENSAETATAGLPEVSIDDNANAVAVWTQTLEVNTHADIYANRFTLNGGWEHAVAIETNNDGEARFPQVAMNNSQAVVAWTEFDGAFTNLYSNVLNDQNQWEGLVLMETNNFSVFQNSQGGVSLALNDNGKAIIAWNQRLVDVSLSLIFTSERQLDMETNWSTPAILAQADNQATQALMPVVGIASDDKVIAVSQRLLNNSLDIQSHKLD